MAEDVIVGTGGAVPTTTGSAGVQSQVPGQATTVSAAAGATGGVDSGNFIDTYLDDQLFRFQSEDTALLGLMLKAKKVKATSPVVEHYMIDEQRSTFTTESAVAAGNAAQFILPMLAKDQNIPRDFHTLLLPDVDGYSDDGQRVTPGKPLMLFVTGRDDVSNNPVVRAINGPKASEGDTFCKTPAIPVGSTIKLLANAMYETQKEVDPDMIVPRPTKLYLQKRGMNQIVSDYFNAQKKRIAFTDAIIAEQAILDFKRRSNRTLWASRKGMLTVKIPKLGEQHVYFTEGVRWQFKRELQHSGEWTIEKLIALAKLFFTGEDVPKSALLLAGKNLLESLQCIDFSKHPEIQVSPYKLPTVGWEVTRIHTVFGDIMVKREPTLDTLGWSNSGALMGEDRLVHYTYSAQHEFSDRVEGEEATRKGIVVWDGLGLKGACHIWIDGEGQGSNGNGVTYTIWDSAEAPSGADLVDGRVYLLISDCAGINASAQAGQLWQAKVTTTGTGDTAVTSVAWSQYAGEIMAE